MGSGVDACKESSDIVILDDNFKSIKDAIFYGRTIYNNILKFCKFQLTINVCALLVSALAPFLGVHEPITVVQLLFVNLVCDSLGSLMIGCEPALREYMLEKPKRRDQPLVSKEMFTQILCMGIYMSVISFIYLLVPQIRLLFNSNEAHLTGYFALLIMMSLFNAFNIRTDDFNIIKDINKNTYFLKVWFLIVFLLVVLCTFGGSLFGTTAFGIVGWVLVILLGVTVIPLDYVRKAILK